MLFSSFSFILLFLPLLLLVWHLVSVWDGRRLEVVLLFFSAAFYAAWGTGFLALLGIMLGMNYLFGLLLATSPDDGSGPMGLSRRGLLTVGLVCNLLPLGWFKYSAFIVEILGQLFQYQCDFQALTLPPGISFYSFIQIAWLVNIYRQQTSPQGFVRHALFSTCFCYVISGPIVRYEQLGRQLECLRGLDIDWLARGFSLFSMGLAKKIIMADSLAVYANAIFNAAERGFPLSPFEAWLGSFCYSFQLYFDFSGYTDMALGLGLMLGLRLPENFNSPYKATGIIEFWRRWHITLSAWLRDFLYIPLGGNRTGRLRQYSNLVLTMFLGGLWHGAGWTFIIWGFLHGLMLSINHFFRMQIRNRQLENILTLLPIRLCSAALTFLCINACWVIFRAASLKGALRMYTTMLEGVTSLPTLFSNVSAGLVAPLLLPHQYLQGWQPFALLAVSAVLIWIFPNSHEIFHGRNDGTKPWLYWRPSALWSTSLAMLAFTALLLASRQSTFLYFQF